MMTTRLTFLYIIVIFLGSLVARADDQVKWGSAVNGLCLGLRNAPASATSDQNLLFTVVVKNVSDQPITVPAPDSFVLKTRPPSENYHELPLTPIVESDKSGPERLDIESPYSLFSGIPIDKVSSKVVRIAPGQSVTWSGLPLETHGYFGARLPENSTCSIQHWYLLRDRSFHIHFMFANEKNVFSGEKVWTGKITSGVANIQVAAPSTDGPKLDGA